MSITVVIPTRNRPQYLKTVLDSVKSQTAYKYISKIIVSENGSTDDSKLVCDNYPELNINYFKQQNSFPSSVGHLSWIIDQSQTKYTAMLHDDDWWYPTHLENALNCLNDTNICYFSNFVFSKNEIGKGAFFHHPSLLSYMIGDRKFDEKISINFDQISTLCYLFTPFHMSSMVGLTTYLKQASNASLKFSKPWYADRILYPFLSVYGNIIFNPQVLCGVRVHENNDANNVDAQARFEDHKEGSKKIEELASSKNVNIWQNWSKVEEISKKEEWDEVKSVYQYYFGNSPHEVFQKVIKINHQTKAPTLFKKIIKKILK